MALRLAHDLVGADVPAHVLQAVAPARVDETVIAIAADRVLSPDAPLRTTSSYMAHFLADGRAGARLDVLLRRVFISRLEIAGMYGVPHDSMRVYGCYVLRLKDLIARYWRVALATGRGKRVEVAEANPTARLMHWLASAD